MPPWTSLGAFWGILTSIPHIFPFYRQADSKDCGATYLKMLAKFYGKIIDIQTLRQLSETTRLGSTLLSLSEGAESIGFRSIGIKMSRSKLGEVPLPCILFWNKNHYVVLYQIKKRKYYIADPAHGLIAYNEEEFLKFWIGNNAISTSEEGIALLLETTPKFYTANFENNKKKILGFGFLFSYIMKYKSFLFQLTLGLLAGSILQLIVAFLTQSIVDVGILNQNLHFIYIILFAQLMLFAGKTSLEIIRSWILLHLST